MYFFYGPNNSENQTYELEELHKIDKHPMYDHNRLTVLYIHGMFESVGIGSTPLIIEAYGTRNDHNLLVLNWGNIAEQALVGVPELIEV